MSTWNNIHKWIIRNGEESKDFSDIRKYQCKGENITEASTLGSTPLHFAVLSSNISLVKHLLETNKVDVNARNHNQATPLHWACHAGYLEIIKTLISHQADCNILDQENNTILHWTASAGHSKVLRYLLMKNKRLINCRNTENNSALAVACEEKEWHAAKVLLQAGADFQELLLESTTYKNYDTVKFLLKHSSKEEIEAVKDIHNRTPMHYATLHNNYRLVKLFSKYCPQWINSKDTKGNVPAKFLHQRSDERLCSLVKPTV